MDFPVYPPMEDNSALCFGAARFPLGYDKKSNTEFRFFVASLLCRVRFMLSSKLQQKIRVGNTFSYLFVFFFSGFGLAAPFFENRLKKEFGLDKTILDKTLSGMSYGTSEHLTANAIRHPFSNRNLYPISECHLHAAVQIDRHPVNRRVP